MLGPEGFSYVARGGDVVISYHGKRATTLRGQRAVADIKGIPGLVAGGAGDHPDVHWGHEWDPDRMLHP